MSSSTKYTINEHKISVVILCYNYGNFLEDAVNSVINQTYKNIETIIINDGSSDNTDSICRSFKQEYPKIRYYNQTNRGVVYSRNKGVRLAQGEYIIFLDADDTLPDNYVTGMVDFATKRPDVDIFYTEAVNLDTQVIVIKPVEYNLEHLKHSNFIHSSSMVRTVVLAKYTYDPNLNMLGYEDWDLYLGMCLGGSTAHLVDGVRLNYRIHKNQPSRSGDGHAGLKSVKAVTYIYSKYMTMYPGEMELLSLPLLNLSISAEIINNISRENETINDKLKDLQKYKDETSHSVSYKIAKVIVWLPSRVKRAAKRVLSR